MLGSPGGSQWQVGSVRTSAVAAGAAAAAAGRTPAGRGRLGNGFPTCVRRAGQRARSGRGAPTPPCPGFHRTAGVSASGVPAAAATPVQIHH
ncbi:Unconventional Myosin-Ixb [Manis pentadactyla]|nr:Unconventional Myosin-Ixb [Manis pentadactyla]